MYRNQGNDTPDFVIVDGFGYKTTASPALMLSELLRHYSFGTRRGEMQ